MQNEKSTNNVKKQNRKSRMLQDKQSMIYALVASAIIVVVLVIGLIIFHNLKKQEQEEEYQKAIMQYQLTEAEHEVVEVREAIPDVYMPVDMFNKDMFNGRYSREEVCLVAALAYCEMGGESVKGIMYAVSVVLNRVNSPYYPNTIEEVIYQAGQYEPALKGTIEKYIDIYYYNDTDGLSEEQLEDYERNFEATLYVFENGSLLPENVLYQAPFSQAGGVYEVVDGEYFCYK